MTNAPNSRKTHVIRILGTNEDGDVLPDIWLDIERMDEIKAHLNNNNDTDSTQQTIRRLKWGDDPAAFDYDPDKDSKPDSRKTVTLKICSPDEEDQSDPTQWVPVEVISGIRFRGDNGSRDTRLVFKNNEIINDPNSRIFKARKITHYATSIDDDAQAAFDADDTLKAYVVPGDQYTKDPDTEDENDFVEHEIIMSISQRRSRNVEETESNDQGKRTILMNQYQIDESHEAELEVTGVDGYNPPWRLDPYQNIVNVQFNIAKFIMTGAVGADGNNIRTFDSDGNILMSAFYDPTGGENTLHSCTLLSDGSPIVSVVNFGVEGIVAKLSRDGKTVEWEQRFAFDDNFASVLVGVDAKDHITVRWDLDPDQNHIVKLDPDDGSIISDINVFATTQSFVPSFAVSPKDVYCIGQENPSTFQAGYFGVTDMDGKPPFPPGGSTSDAGWVSVAWTGLGADASEFFYGGIVYQEHIAGVDGDEDPPPVGGATYLHKIAATTGAVIWSAELATSVDSITEPYYFPGAVDADKDGQSYVANTDTTDRDPDTDEVIVHTNIQAVSKDGAVLWQMKNDDDDFNSGCIVADKDGVIVVRKNSTLTKLDSKTGAQVWEYNHGAAISGLGRTQYKPKKDK